MEYTIRQEIVVTYLNHITIKSKYFIIILQYESHTEECDIDVVELFKRTVKEVRYFLKPNKIVLFKQQPNSNGHLIEVFFEIPWIDEFTQFIEKEDGSYMVKTDNFLDFILEGDQYDQHNK